MLQFKLDTSLFDAMNKIALIAVVLCCSALGFAQSPAVARLQCDGTYNNYTSSDLRDIRIQGIYVEISDKQVRVVGAPGFDSTYVVTNYSEGGVGIQLSSNHGYFGYLNRFSGQLSLTERGEEGAKGSWKAIQTISASCKRATPLF